MAITDGQIANLEKLLEESTDGPWEAGCGIEKVITGYRDKYGNMTDDNYLHGGWAKTVAIVTHNKWKHPGNARADQLLIAAAKNLLPDLLAEIKELRQAN